MPSLLRRLLAPFSRTSRGATATSASQTVVPAVETVEVDPRSIRPLTLTYGPKHDGAPDAGEVVWTWVPFVERDGRGKDRPVLVIARHDAERVYAVKLTSRSHDGEREYVAIGAGAWDPQRRPSWVDVDQLYLVHERGMRREAAALDDAGFARVAAALEPRYGWRFRR